MSIAFPTIAWANGTNIYEVNVRQYTREGTLNAFAKHIPRLHDMGVDILWFMPVTPVSIEKRQGSLGSNYAARSYTEIDPFYGTIDDFRQLIAAAHEYGMKVIIDWVANHTGYDHVWTKKFPQYYRKDAEGNFTEIYGWIDVIDLDYEVPELRRAMIDSMKYWVNTFDIDGFRCDMARTVPIDFWIEARTECDAVKPMFWLAECEILSYHEAFDVTYGWECMRACDKYFKDDLPFSEVMESLVKYSHYPIGSRKLLFTSNHDENSYWGTEYEKYDVSAKAMAVFSCTFPGIPLIYSGQEKPNLNRLKFFEKDLINWDGEIELHEFYKKLLLLRKQNEGLQENASMLLIKSGHPEVLVYLCRRANDKVLVILNLSKEAANFIIDHPAIAGQYLNLFEENKFISNSPLKENKNIQEDPEKSIQGYPEKNIRKYSEKNIQEDPEKNIQKYPEKSIQKYPEKKIQEDTEENIHENTVKSIQGNREPNTEESYIKNIRVKDEQSTHENMEEKIIILKRQVTFTFTPGQYLVLHHSSLHH